VIVYGADKEIADWVSRGLGGNVGMFEPCTALGVVSRGTLSAGIVFNNYQETIDGKPLLIEMTIFSVDSSWCTRHNLRKIFEYPFAQLKLERVQAICSSHNEGVIMFLKRVGFTHEGTHPKAYLDGGDALSFGMLKKDCKWIGGQHG